MMSCRNVDLHSALAFFLTAGLVACGGGGGGGTSSTATTSPSITVSSSPISGTNILSVLVDSGPNGTDVNRLYTTVKVCQLGSSTVCQTIDHVLVDTGSTGLRLLASELTNPAITQNRITTSTSLPLLNCAQFIDLTYAWGPVTTVDVTLGGETATGVPIQLIGDPAFAAMASQCSANGAYTALNSISVLGAKGILGISLFKQDCGTACVTQVAYNHQNSGNGFYYTCTNASCTASVGTTASLTQQVSNPVPLFAINNNGFIVDLPEVNPPGANLMNGAVIFGIGTQANNQFSSGSVLTTNSVGYVTTQLAAATFVKSFIDTGSNGIYFNTTTLPTCGHFYCPVTATTLTTTMTGANSGSASVPFTVSNAQELFSA